MDSKAWSGIPSLQRVNIEFTGLSMHVQDEKKASKTVLKDVSGRFGSGQLTALIGPSGAGKSSLMNILSGFRLEFSGEILINGRPRNPKTFRKQSCFVMQENHLLPLLSVHESMTAAAALKLGDRVSGREKAQVVSSILETMGLKECCQTRVANLSGGEKKRLSIAQELVNNPPVMFFDEPTSGLDSQNSFQCINLLQCLAREGRTIVCTIHQPSGRMLDKFDVLFALAQGHCVYSGSTGDLVPFLQTVGLNCPPYYSPTDFLIEASSGVYGSYVPQMTEAVTSRIRAQPTEKSCSISGTGVPLWRGSCKSDAVTLEAESLHLSDEGREEGRHAREVDTKLLHSDEVLFTSDYPSSFRTQFAVLFKRTFLCIIRDTMLTKLRILVHVVVGTFIGILYFGIGNEGSQILDNIKCIFCSIITVVISSMMTTIITFPVERDVFLKEHLNRWYSLKAYYFAKTTADLPFQFVFPVLYMVFMYFMTGQPLDTERMGLFALASILTALVAQSLGLAIGAAFDIQHAVFLGITSFVPAVLFSGFFATFSTIPVYLKWLTYTSYIRYCFVGLLLAIYGRGREKLNCSQAFCVFRSPDKVLQYFGIEDSSLWLELFLLFIYFLAMRGLCYVVLLYKLKTKR